MYAKFMKHNRKPKQPQVSKQKSVVVFQSDSLGFSVVQNRQTLTNPLSNMDWQSILDQGSFGGYSHNQVYFTFLKGIPDKLRMRIWLMLANIKPQTHPQHLQQYLKALAKPLNPDDKHQIQVDIARSYSNNEQYSYTKPMLKRILSASISNGIIYTQGMNYIALHVLIFCLESENKPKQDFNDPAFESLVCKIFTYLVHQLNFIFGQNLSNIFIISKQLQSLMTEVIPQILFHLAKFGLDCTILFAQNYFSLMMYSSPPHSIAKMILDLFLVQGKNAIHAILVRMLEICLERVIQCSSPEKLQRFVKFQMFEVCAGELDREREQARCIGDFGLAFYTKEEVDV